MHLHTRTSKVRSYLFLVGSILLAIGGGAFYYHVQKQIHQEQVLIEAIEKALETEISQTAEHFKTVSASRENFMELFRHSQLPVSYYLFESGRLAFWSDFEFVPSPRDVSGIFGAKILAKRESFYLLTKYEEDETSEYVYAIPLVVKYPIVNEYLKSRVNERIFSSENFEISLSPKNDFRPIQIEGNNGPLFYIKLSPAYAQMSGFQQVVINAFIISALLLFLLFIRTNVTSQVRKGYHSRGFLWLFGGLAVLRMAMIYFNYPYLFSPNELFDSRNYASSFVNPSLGDLLLNVLVVFAWALFLFRYYLKIRFFKRFVGSAGRRGYLYSALAVLVTLLLLSVYFLLFNSLNLHSQWSLDISTELNFHFLKVVSYAIVIIAGIVYFFFSHIVFAIVIHKYRHSAKDASLVFLLGASLFILASILGHWNFVVISIVNSIYFFLLYVFHFPRSLRRIQYLTFVYFFVASVPLCIVGAYSVYRYQIKKLVQEKNRLAGELLVENDVLTEYLLNEAAEQISEDVFIQNRIINPYVSKINIRQRVQRIYLNNQLEKYDVAVHLFNSRGSALDESGLDLNEILNRYREFQLDSSLYFINQYDANSLKRYLKVVEIKRYSRIAGYVLIDLRLKRVVPNSVYPLLLIDNRYSGPNIGSEYSYAVYENGALIFNSGDFNYSERLTGNFDLAKAERNTGYYDGELVHFSVQGEESRIYIISLQAYPIRNVFSNFSFLFVLFLGMILHALIVVTVYFKLKGVQQNYASRIQLFLNGAFLIPLMVICVSTVSVIVKSYNENLEAENLEQASNISIRISENLNRYLKREISRENLSEEVNSISRFAEIDINVFGNNGRLLATSQPLIYENDLLAEVINPAAFVHIVYQNVGGMVLDEHLGRLYYKNTYMPIQSPESGNRIGILSLPYFDVRKKLEENVVSVLTNVLNIFTVIFLIFLVLSYLASTWLTYPLRLITHKIRKTSLLDKNEPLEWNSDDEIGLMVGEYNTMLLNLEESKKALARSEKESAWREIARQVAHEIKNPLTPMQLTLQHMKRTLDEDLIDKEKRKRQIDALLHQINTLNDIATSFSTFAKMPVPQNEVFEFSELVKDTVALYDKQKHLALEVAIDEGEFFVSADKKWMGQAISNILINGIHAVEDRKKKMISVSLVFHGKNKMLLTITDNGKGIGDDIRSKIFMPNFSTKETGSGIGLAIAKRAVEHAGGEIWFESEIAKGTAFYIELPLVK